MGKDILDMYNPEPPQGKRAECGGVLPKDKKDLPYSPPKGPTQQMRNAVGLGGEVMPCGTQGKR